MGKQTITIKISPALAQAMGVTLSDECVDYFTLFGVPRTDPPADAIDAAVLERSRALREWQSSAQYGKEVVTLLRTIQQAAKILKDPKRVEAYRATLEREERGESLGATEEFLEMVRAALADGQITPAARRELNQFARHRGIEPAQARELINQVQQDIQAQAAQQPAAAAADWEFRLAEEGETPYELMLSGMVSSGRLLDETSRAEALAQAGKYKIAADRAAAVLAGVLRRRFGEIVQVVAGGGVVSDNQARLLIDKATLYGLNQTQAYEIISEYSLSAYSAEEMLRNLALAQTFNQDEIGQMLDDSAAGLAVKKTFWQKLSQSLPGWLSKAALGALGVGAVVLAGVYLANRTSPPPSGVIERAHGNQTSQNQDPATSSTQTATQVQPTVQLVSLPDPASGMLRLDPTAPDDPPAFEIAITEVTCAQFQAYLDATLEQPPLEWVGGKCPSGWANRPVTGVSWDQAKAFCEWLAGQKGLAREALTLPNQVQYLRASRGPTLRGQADDPGYWQRAKLSGFNQPQDVKSERWDKIFVQDQGQIYDLVGNVAEWGSEQQAGQALVLGGDYSQKASDFNHLQARWENPARRTVELGFRYVIALEN